MGRKRKLDKLSLDMIECEKAGYGCHYGRWKAAQTNPVVKKEESIPKGWKKCEYCGKVFKPKCGQRFCEPYCRSEAYKPKLNAQRRAYMRDYREREIAGDTKGG